MTRSSQQPKAKNQQRVVLLLLRCALRSLQRVHRAAFTGESTTLTRRRNRIAHHHVTALRTRYRAFEHQQVFVLVEAQDAQVARRLLRVTHVTGHAHSREYTRRERRRADRTVDREHRSVRLRTSGKLVALHHTGEAAALGRTNHIHELLAVKQVHQHAIADLHHLSHAVAGPNRALGSNRKLAHELHGWQVV